MASMNEGVNNLTNTVAQYKALLRDVINERPSGTRQRLAEALDKNRSFVSQITNPGYSTPIPVKHLGTIFDVCIFSAAQKRQFLSLYQKAHPKRSIEAECKSRTREVSITIPTLKNEALDKALDHILQQYADSIAKVIDKTQP